MSNSRCCSIITQVNAEFRQLRLFANFRRTAHRQLCQDFLELVVPQCCKRANSISSQLLRTDPCSSVNQGRWVEEMVVKIFRTYRRA